MFEEAVQEAAPPLLQPIRGQYCTVPTNHSSVLHLLVCLGRVGGVAGAVVRHRAAAGQGGHHAVCPPQRAATRGHPLMLSMVLSQCPDIRALLKALGLKLFLRPRNPVRQLQL